MKRTHFGMRQLIETQFRRLQIERTTSKTNTIANVRFNWAFIGDAEKYLIKNTSVQWTMDNMHILTESMHIYMSENENGT